MSPHGIYVSPVDVSGAISHLRDQSNPQRDRAADTNALFLGNHGTVQLNQLNVDQNRSMLRYMCLLGCAHVHVTCACLGSLRWHIPLEHQLLRAEILFMLSASADLFLKLTFFKLFFQEYHQHFKRFRSRSAPKSCRC